MKVAPASVLYRYLVMVELFGSSQKSAAWVSPGVAERLVGAGGVGAGVATVLSETGPGPLVFTARIAKSYDV